MSRRTHSLLLAKHVRAGSAPFVAQDVPLGPGCDDSLWDVPARCAEEGAEAYSQPMVHTVPVLLNIARQVAISMSYFEEVLNMHPAHPDALTVLAWIHTTFFNDRAAANT